MEQNNEYEELEGGYAVHAAGADWASIEDSADIETNYTLEAHEAGECDPDACPLCADFDRPEYMED